MNVLNGGTDALYLAQCSHMVQVHLIIVKCGVYLLNMGLTLLLSVPHTFIVHKRTKNKIQLIQPLSLKTHILFT